VGEDWGRFSGKDLLGDGGFLGRTFSREGRFVVETCSRGTFLEGRS
jgi:hypothetical protein